ncbi:MAG: hypothetical protein ABEL51_13175 [Salinibacter sp.]
MSTAVLQPDRPDAQHVRRQIRRRAFYISAEPSSCREIKREAAKKHKGESSRTRIDDVETEEDAIGYLKGVRRRHEEGKTTRLPG